ncbi:MAG: zinc transport system permease protein [Bradymonadia bacterium]|jgi:zinc transport system permease protein
MLESLTVFFEAWELFREPTLAGAFAGLALGSLGVWIVLRRLVFLSATLSQVAGLGVASTVVMGTAVSLAVPPLLGAVVLTLGVAFLLASRERDGDAWLGGAYLASTAGTLILAGYSGQELHDIDVLLFGSAVAVLPEQFRVIVIICAVAMVFQVWWHRGFAAVTVDRVDARVRGLPVRTIDAVLVGSAAVVVATTTWALGALPAFAFSVLPGLAALALRLRLRATVAVAGVIGLLSGGGGYVLAFLLDWPVGPAQTALACAFVLMCGALRVSVLR